MTAVPDITFYGSSGHCYAVAVLFGLPNSAYRRCNIVAFIDDFRGGTGVELAGRPVISWEEWREGYSGIPCMVPIGDGADRRRLVTRVADSGGSFLRLQDPAVMQALGITVGAGTFLMPPGYVGANTTIGDHAQIMPLHSIGHDVTIERFATVAPSVTISGYVTIEDGAFIGAGATIVNGRPGQPLIIGAGAVVAAGAVVMKSVGPGMRVMGNPARTLRQLAARAQRGE